MIAVVAASCGQRVKKIEEQKAQDEVAVLTLRDSVHLVEGLGPIVESTFTGVIPAASNPGQRLVLTFYHQEYGAVGVYHLERTYFEANDGQDEIFEETGRWTMLETDGNPIIVMTDEGNGTQMAFIFHGETIEMLDANMQPISSEHNYTLTRVEENVRVAE